jgi:hypothetical protein
MLYGPVTRQALGGPARWRWRHDRQSLRSAGPFAERPGHYPLERAIRAIGLQPTSTSWLLAAHHRLANYACSGKKGNA